MLGSDGRGIRNSWKRFRSGLRLRPGRIAYLGRVCAENMVSSDGMSQIVGYDGKLEYREKRKSRWDAIWVGDSPFDGLTGAVEHVIRLLGATARTHCPSIVWGELLGRSFGRSLPRDNIGTARFSGHELRTGELRAIRGFVGVG